ncbi:NADH-quinone oxidoreductase subunit C [Streptomyces sp.]|uniref:NADH-quinone oxidoreductase subunit C n=1 Tax=Streptomyces sp. TaxID=1931 RepID=UPI0028111990|nr:NADH-quinone oxidoreductase subunit C [Streptomyces sp.]
MNRYDSLPEAVTDLFGDEAAAERAYDLLTVDVPVTDWLDALRTARDELGCTFFDWLSAVDEPGTGFRVCAHVVALRDGAPQRLLLRTTVPHGDPVLPTAVGVFAGAAWHERETHEMFGVRFEGHPHLVPLLLPENFEGHPLRKDFVLAARVAKAWPGAKEPGESHDGGPKRRQMLPPGVPDPNEWGPLKGQLPPAPTRADRPARRTRTATEGSASQAAEAAPPRRTRSVSEGSASQAAEAVPPRRTRSVSEGSAGQPAPRRTRSASDGSASQAAAPSPAAPRPRPRGADAPWHHARPAFDAPTEDAEPTAGATPAAEPAGTAGGAAATPDTRPEPEAPAAEQPQDPAESATPAEPQPPAEGAAPPEPEGEPRRRTPRTDENDTDGGDPA